MILSNQRYCDLCNESVYSSTRHDSQACTCGNVMVDGGMDYLRHSVNGVDQSIVISDEHYNLLLEAMTDETKNNLGKLCNVARVLRDEMGINISERDHGEEKE